VSKFSVFLTQKEIKLFSIQASWQKFLAICLSSGTLYVFEPALNLKKFEARLREKLQEYHLQL